MDVAGGRLQTAREDAVGWLTMNQPGKRNALSIDMWEGLADILSEWSRDDAIRAVVLTGAGDEAFSSGADISQFDTFRNSGEAQKEYARRTDRGRIALAEFPKPVIAAINGFCIGGGLGVAMGSDIRLAADHAQFGIPAVRLGIAYDLRTTDRLISLIGPARASQLLFTGSRFDAATALQWGLVDVVTAPSRLRETAARMADGIASNAPMAVRAMKATIKQALKAPAERDAELVNRLVEACFDSSDYAEGRQAFHEKRRPRFTGR